MDEGTFSLSIILNRIMIGSSERLVLPRLMLKERLLMSSWYRVLLQCLIQIL